MASSSPSSPPLAKGEEEGEGARLGAA